jgi:phage-related protein
MPTTQVVFYQSSRGVAEVLRWLEKLSKGDNKGVLKCLNQIEVLREFGNELDRPDVAQLRDGIYELRVKNNRTQYRILYFFHEGVAVLAHGIVKKETRVPEADIDRAIDRQQLFTADPLAHTYTEESDEEELN